MKANTGIWLILVLLGAAGLGLFLARNKDEQVEKPKFEDETSSTPGTAYLSTPVTTEDTVALESPMEAPRRVDDSAAQPTGVASPEPSLEAETDPVSLADGLAEHYGLSPEEIRELLTEQLDNNAQDVLDLDLTELVSWESVSEQVIAGLVEKIETASMWSGDRVALELLHSKKRNVRDALEECLSSAEFEAFDEASRELAINHGVSTIPRLEAAHQHLFQQMQTVALEKARSGRVDIFPVLAIKKLLKHSRAIEGRMFWARHTVNSWTAQAAVYRGEDPRVTNALQARNDAFDLWWSDVAAIAGVQGF